MAGRNGTAAPAEEVVGQVEQTNDKGVKVAGQWWNFSQYHVTLRPEVGARVAITGAKGFIRSLEVLSEPVPPLQDETVSAPSRELLIIRQCVIKAASEFCASRSDLKSADLFALAERMEAWVTR